MRVFENHKQWSAVKEVCRRLKEARFQALLAGGCVRDLLMNREPHDFDIATNATPDQVEALFPKSLPVGKSFGVIILPCDDFQIEIATFREDLEYKDGRRPEGVKFSTPEADAARRDFTVNALFYDIDTKKVIDFVGGEKDLQQKILRTVGEPEQRFTEDKLRLLRAVRLSAQLDFLIEPRTFEAVVRLAPEIRLVSRERVRDEILKLLKLNGRIQGLRLLLVTGLLSELFPTASDRIHEKETEWLERYMLLPQKTPELALDPAFLWTLFFWPAFDPNASKDFRDNCLKDVRLDGKLIETILFALQHLPHYLHPQSVRKGLMIQNLAHPSSLVAEGLAKLTLATAGGKSGTQSGSSWAELQNHFQELRKALTARGEKPEAFISGTDAKEAGFAPGPKMGQVLQEAYLLQLEGALNSREQAFAWLNKRSRS